MIRKEPFIQHHLGRNTLFQKHKRRLYRWKSPDGQHWNQIDCILCSKRWSEPRIMLLSLGEKRFGVVLSQGPWPWAFWPARAWTRPGQVRSIFYLIWWMSGLSVKPRHRSSPCLTFVLVAGNSLPGVCDLTGKLGLVRPCTRVAPGPR